MAKQVQAQTNDVLADHDAVGLAEAIRRRDISPREAAEAARARIQAVDGELNAVEQARFEEAVSNLGDLGRGGFAGVPTMIKDNMDVRGWPTRHGAEAFTPPVADNNDPFVDQFLDQGFTVLGKTRLPEFGFNGSTEFQNQEPVRNPWHTDYTAGGSSGGAAALVASGALPIAHGNDGGGSIRIPAAASGLVGFKSTRGRLVKSLASRSLPVNLISEGVLSRTVRDTARFLAQAEQYHQPRRLPPVGLVEGPGSKRLKVGVVLDSITGTPTDTETRETVEATARALQHHGHGVEEIAPPVPERFIEDFKTYYGFMAFMVSRFGHRMMAPDFDPEKLDGLTRGLAAYYAERKRKTPAVMTILQLSRFYYARAMRDFDVIISPVLGHTVPELGWLNPNVPFETLFERLIQYASFTPANNASGGPAVSLPMGMSRAGTPIGVQAAAAHGDERTLLEVAFALEQDPGWQSIRS